MAISCEVLDSIEAVEPVVADWDGLAVSAGQPYCAPAWLLAWWRHAAPAGGVLRVMVLRDQGRVVGLAPLYAERWAAGLWSWSLLATKVTSRVEPLAEPAMRQQVAEALAAALAEGQPAVAEVELNGLPGASYWPGALRSAWPGRRRPFHHQFAPTPAPTVPLAGLSTLDDWLETRSSNFRQQMRRARRRFEKDGGVFRVASSTEEIERGMRDFERLHTARWEDRGGSEAMTAGIDRMLVDAGRELASSGRFLLMSMEIGGRTISSQLFVAAGEEISYWNGGFDDAGEFGAYKPAMSSLVEAIRLSIEHGYTRLDLGPGAQDYKYRFSDVQDEIVWQSLIPPGRRAPLAHALFAPSRARVVVSERLSDEQKAKVKRVLRRG